MCRLQENFQVFHYGPMVDDGVHGSEIACSWVSILVSYDPSIPYMCQATLFVSLVLLTWNDSGQSNTACEPKEIINQSLFVYVHIGTIIT